MALVRLGTFFVVAPLGGISEDFYEGAREGKLLGRHCAWKTWRLFWRDESLGRPEVVGLDSAERGYQQKIERFSIFRLAQP